jgi:transposase
MSPGGRVPYKVLRQLSPQAARLAVLEYLKTNGGNIADAARVFGVNRAVVYDILRKQGEGDLRDRPRTPRRQPRKTPAAVEELVIEAKNRTHLGPQRLSLRLEKDAHLKLPAGTIRHILRRNRQRLVYPVKPRQQRKERRQFVDWYSAKPFEIVQMDVKFIRDRKALTPEQILHLDQGHVPNYQWDALDVNSRFKLLAYSYEKSWTNGLCFYLWVIAALRSQGVTARIVFTVDNGEEFGGKSWMKVRELRTLIAGFGCQLVQNHKGHPEENAHIERSHRTDDDEFYIPRALAIHSPTHLLDEAFKYLYYYNTVREHSALGFLPPFAYLKQQLPTIDDRIRYVQPFMLDNVSVQLGPWSGYNVLAQHPDSGVFHFRGRE